MHREQHLMVESLAAASERDREKERDIEKDMNMKNERYR